jgi:uncharacterized membrane protein
VERDVGRLLIGIGVAVVVLGVLVQVGALRWFGNLPGDIRIEGDNSRIFVPITSMIVLSVVLSVLLNVWSRLR